ncbi:hypothetical protein KC930_04090 [Candidatus Saccharibacteria bacterium]|nr:hypothetical protein [Candidatus Saccharibacteria bacterium]
MQQPIPTQQHPSMAMPSSAKKKRLTPMQLTAVILLFGVAILAVLMIVYMVIGGPKSLTEAVKKDQYQAVFLNSQDGQVYFGKLANYNSQFYKLTDIYYVRVENKIQPEGQNTSSTSQQNISLAKLGNELHGPEDEMYIAKDKVLFWENLKDDGQVVKAITEYKKNPDSAKSSSSSNSSSTNSTSTTDTTTNSSSTNQ